MYAQVEKIEERKSRAVTQSVSQKKRHEKQSFGFVDNRSETIAQRKLQDSIGRAATRELGAGERGGSINNQRLQNHLASNTTQLMSSARTVAAADKDQLAGARNSMGKYIWNELTHNVAVIDGQPARRGVSDKSSHSEPKAFIEELAANNIPHIVDMLTERPPCTSAEGTGCWDYFTNYVAGHAGWDFNFRYLTTGVNPPSNDKQLYGIYRVAARNPRIPQSAAGDAAV